MARVMCYVFGLAFLTAAFGYPSTNPSSRGWDSDASETSEMSSSTEAASTLGNVNTRQDASSTVSNGKSENTTPDERTSEDDYEDDSDMYMELQDDQDEAVKVDGNESKVEDVVPTTPASDNQGMGQHFFPSFSPVFPLGHSRPPQLYHQEPYYNKPRAHHSSVGHDYNPFRAYRDSSFKVPISVEDDLTSSNILGSGNFGILRGGTYYNDEDRSEYGGFYNPYYSNNGHGRPYAANPRPQKYSNGDFFANFRDFADINTPTKASFSEYVVVYVNKNGSRADAASATSGVSTRPKNIIEQLSLLDESEAAVPEKKESLHKRKLALLHEQRKNKEKKSYFKKKEPLEPLLALS